MRYIFLCLFVLHFGAMAGDQPASAPHDDKLNGGIVYGKDHAFIIVAPDGWVLDNSSGVPRGLHAVLYKTGTTWAKADTVMYANTVHKEASGEKVVGNVIKSDVKSFQASASNQCVITDAPDLKTRSGQRVAVKQFFDASRHVYEAVAYIDESKIVVLLVLSAREEQAFTAALPAFKRLVASCRFLTSDVIESGARP